MRKRMQGIMLGLSLIIGLCMTGFTAQAYTATEVEDTVVTEEERAYWTQFSDTYVYGTLNEQEKAVWDIMEEACLKLAATTNDYESENMKVYYDSSIDYYRMVDIAFMFQHSNPQYYFVTNSVIFATDHIIMNVYDEFADGEARAAYTEQFTTKINGWLETIAQQERPEQKIKAAHDIICLNTVYGSSDYDQSAYSMVCEGKTVCAGYAKTMTLLGNAAGIETFAVTSPSHAWNFVKLHDVWYELDVTSDDNNFVEATEYFATYWHYNVSRATIEDDSHTMYAQYASIVPPTLYDMSVAVIYQNPYIEVGGNTYFIVNDNKELANLMVKRVEGSASLPATVTYYDKVYNVLGGEQPDSTPTPTLSPDYDKIKYSGQEDGISWTITYGGHLSVTGAFDDEQSIVWGVTPMWTQYANEIVTAYVNISNATDLSFLLQNHSKLISVDLSDMDTSKVKNMAEMFYGCRSLTEIDVSNFDTSNVTNMSGMFGECKALQNLNLSNFDTSAVTNMGWMFYGCSALTEIDVSALETGYVENMSCMFAGCEGLSQLDLSGFFTWSVRDMSWMFKDCSNLSTIYVGDAWYIEFVEVYGMFDGCGTDHVTLKGYTPTPTALPTARPTTRPTASPTAAPTAAPTAIPTTAPSASPTVAPTTAPTTAPTAEPGPDIPDKNWADDYTGLYMDENLDWWYIENGEVNLNYTGLAFVNEKWWCVISGKIDFTYHGFLDANGASWYIVNGEVAFDYNGLACVNDEWFYIVGGRLDSSFNGMAYVNDAWWYVVNGKVDFSFTGLTYVNEKWWYVNAGRIDFSYHGICEFNGATYYIENGEINYAAAGMVCVGTDWYYVENGLVRTDYSGMLFVNDAWWYVVNGKIDFEFSGLFLFNGAYWFVSQGQIILGYVGLVFYDNQWWYLENGVVNFDYNGFAFVNDIWWWVEGGKIDFTHTGIHQFNGTWWYVSGAQIDFTYNGTVTGTDGNTYEVVNGEVLNYSL